MKTKKHIVLKGEGVNQHVLYGDLDITEGEFSNFVVTGDGILRHETPGGKFAEHNTLKVEAGEWVTANQVEFNPFNRTVSRIWD